MTTCPVCNAQNQPGALFCEMCGSRLQAATPGIPAAPAAAPVVPAAAPAATPGVAATGGGQCPTCGKAALPGEAFCDECGTPLGAPAAAAAPAAAPVPPAQPAPQASYPPPTPIAPAAASTCPSCGAATIPGEAFCDTCGASLLGGAVQPVPVAAAPIQPAAPVQPAPRPAAPAPPAVAPVQPAPVAAAPVQPAPRPAAPPVQPALQVARLADYVLRTASGAAIALPAKGEAVIGREDAPSNNYPEVDLGPFNALAEGVGRRHARIFVQGSQVQIEDLDSTNGTAVNRQRLGARQPQPLQVGDEIRLGKLLLTFGRQDATP